MNHCHQESTMHVRRIALPAITPRNRVVIALALLARKGSGKHTSATRRKDADRRDLDQRVRECGEW